jgi:ubiquinone biosynthesis protein COQ9
VLNAALARAPLEGFAPAMLAQALADAGATTDLFPGGCAALIEYWSQGVDAEMTASLAGRDLTVLKVRERIRTAVLTRLAILAPYKLAARQAAVFLALPHHTLLAAKLLSRTADAMWRAVGDTSKDFNWYSKRAILAGVYAATEVAWFGDNTPDGRGAAVFLDARIDNVMQYEKLKARFRAATATKEQPS